MNRFSHHLETEVWVSKFSLRRRFAALRSPDRVESQGVKESLGVSGSGWRVWLVAAAVVGLVWLGMALGGSSPGSGGWTQASHSGTRYFFYLSDRRVVTLEVVNAERAILNYINIGDSFELIDAKRLVILDGAGGAYHGQVIELENVEDPRERYGVTDLLKPGQFVGYTILGDYRFESPAERALLLIGGTIVELDGLSREDFELVAARIEEMDLGRGDRRTMIIMSGFDQGYGRLHAADSEQAEQWARFFPDPELWPPVLLASPLPLVPAAARELPDPVEVKVQLVVTRAGGLYDMKVVQGLNPEVDRVAVQAVSNSWRWLPAVSNDQVVDAQLTVTVRFQRER